MGDNLNDIRANAQIKFILQLDAEFELLPEFAFNKNEINEIKKLRARGQAFLKFGNVHSSIIDIDATPFEEVLCSTDFESLKQFSNVNSDTFDKIKLAASLKGGKR